MKYTRFEKARMIGARALQITMGAPVLLKLGKDIIDPVIISELEFENGVLPISVLRET
ncbi:MAG: DNA-directed RNA polymerase subunit K [Thermoplasmata archaeon]|nr:MAG: DNA-directed RNA polymerase subunit K [Thermoplasmata archaeon]